MWVEGLLGSSFAPVSQTLIVLSVEPDTIVLPSGEKTTQAMPSLWEMVFSLFSSNVAVREARSGQDSSKAVSGSTLTRIPDFERPWVRLAGAHLRMA